MTLVAGWMEQHHGRPPSPADLGNSTYTPLSILKLLKGTSARSINKLLGSCGPVWQEESFDHVLRSQASLEENSSTFGKIRCDGD